MRYTLLHTSFIFTIYSIIQQQVISYSIYAFVTRTKDFVGGSYVYMFAEETIGNRDCQYLSIPASYYTKKEGGSLNFTQNNCSSTLYPPIAPVYEHPLYPRNLSYVISVDKTLTFVCTPFRDYTENDSMEYNCVLTRSNVPPVTFPTLDMARNTGDFSGQIVVIPILVFLALLLLLVTFLFQPLPSVSLP